jgi:hypothetical protein
MKWRRERDSNPRRGISPYSLSRGALSTTQPSLRSAISALSGAARAVILLTEVREVKLEMPGQSRLVGAFGLAFRFFALDSLVDLFTVHSYVLRSIDPDPHLISFDSQDCDRDITSDHDRLASPSRQNKHDFLLLPGLRPFPF